MAQSARGIASKLFTVRPGYRNSGLASALSTPQRSDNFLAARRQVDKELEGFAGLLLKAIQGEFETEASPPGSVHAGATPALAAGERTSPVTPPTTALGAEAASHESRVEL